MIIVFFIAGKCLWQGW